MRFALTQVKGLFLACCLNLFAALPTVAAEAGSAAESHRRPSFHYPKAVVLSDQQLQQVDQLFELLIPGNQEQASVRLNTYFSRAQWQINRDLAYARLEVLLAKIRQKNRFEAQNSLTEYFWPWFSEEVPDVAFLYLYAAAGNYFYFSEFDRLWQLFQPLMPYLRRMRPLDPQAKDALATSLFYYAQILNRKNRPREALQELFAADAIYQSMSSQHPQMFRIQAIIGETWLELKEYAKAEKYVRLGLEHFPATRRDARGYISALLARSLTRQNKHQQALEILQKYFNDPVDQRTDYRLFILDVYAEVLANVGNMAEAIAVAKNALALALDYNNQDLINQANYRLGSIYFAHEEYEKARRFLETAAEGPTGSRRYKPPEMYQTLIKLLKQQQDYQQALERFEEFKRAADAEREATDLAKVRDLELSYQLAQMAANSKQQKLQLNLVKERELRARETSRWLTWVLLMALIIIAVVFVLLLMIRRSRKKFEQLSNEDPLTGLKNRRFVDQFMQTEAPRLLRRRSFVGVILIDIDYFKKINDEYGHDMGDEILSAFAKFLKQHRREEDVICRWGGEEFLLICRIDAPWAVEHICRQIKSALAEKTFTHKALKITVSMGAGIFPQPAHADSNDDAGYWQTQWLTLLRNVDAALYNVKQAGRNNWQLVTSGS